MKKILLFTIFALLSSAISAQERLAKPFKLYTVTSRFANVYDNPTDQNLLTQIMRGDYVTLLVPNETEESFENEGWLKVMTNYFISKENSHYMMPWYDNRDYLVGWVRTDDFSDSVKVRYSPYKVSAKTVKTELLDNTAKKTEYELLAGTRLGGFIKNSKIMQRCLYAPFSSGKLKLRPLQYTDTIEIPEAIKDKELNFWLYDDMFGFLSKTDIYCSSADAYEENKEEKSGQIIRIAKQFIGSPYLKGGATYMGIDGPNLVNLLYNMFAISSAVDAHGLYLIHGAKKIKTKDLKTGNLIFISNPAKSDMMEDVMIFLGEDDVLAVLKDKGVIKTTFKELFGKKLRQIDNGDYFKQNESGYYSPSHKKEENSIRIYFGR
jgi:NlpC/P60 family